MNGYVYILKTKGDHYYVGSTNNIERRITEHQKGKTVSLRKLLPIKLVLKKKYNSINIARKIEKKLKRFKNRQIIERIIQENDIHMES